MAKQKTEITKSEEIRQILRADPKAKAKDVVDALAAKGIPVKSAQVYFIMGTLKKRKPRTATAGATATETDAAVPANGDALKTILKVKSWAAEVGGLMRLKALVEALSE